MNNSCPKCGNQLKLWEEYVFREERLVSKHSGKVYSNKKKTKPIDLGIAGLLCTSNKCDFEYYANFTANDKDYPQLYLIFENFYYPKDN